MDEASADQVFVFDEDQRRRAYARPDEILSNQDWIS
jgi:hypothetical protein